MAGAVVGLTAIAYLPAWRGPFVWNDRDFVTRPDLRGAAGLRRIWLEPGATEQYYPVLHSAFWAEHRLWGDAALGYHLTNIGLHALAACLFALVLRRVAGTAGAALGVAGIGWEWIAALIFALHPVCVESVAWISEQKNTLSTVLYLLAAWLYLRPAIAEGRGRARSYLLATFVFVLAVLAKSVTATLPGALLVALWWRQGRLGWRRDITPLVPWLVLGAAGGLFTAWVERRYIGATGAAFDLGFAQRILVAGRVAWFYLGKLLWPVDLTFIYPRWRVNAFSWRQWLFPLGVAAILALLWRLRTRIGRSPLAAYLFFIGSLFPVLGFFNVYGFAFSFVADHFQYVPCLGPIALAAAGMASWSGPMADADARSGGRRLLPAAATVIAVGALGILTWRQCGRYRDVLTFYQSIIDRNPGSAMAQNNLGIELDREGRTPEAMLCYGAALRLQPENPDAHNNLGADLTSLGRSGDAIAHFQTALQFRPDFLEARVNLANALRKEGRLVDAIEAYKVALRLRPDYPETRKGLGLALAAAGHFPEAIDQYREVLRLRPGSAEVWNNLGLALLALGRVEEAIPSFQSALQSEPDLLQGQLNLGVALSRAGRIREAMQCYAKALSVKPDFAEAHNNLGLLLAQTGQMERAVAEFRAAIHSDFDYADAHQNLGVALLALGRATEGAEQIETAAHLKAGIGR